MIQYRIVWNDRILYHITCYHSTIFTFLAWYDIISYRLIQYHIIQNVNNMIQYILYHIILYNYYTILYHMIFNQLINTSYWLPMLRLVFINVVHLNYFKETVLHSKRALYWLLTKQKRRDKKNNFKIKTKLVFLIILFEKCTQHVKMLCQPFSTFQKCLCISSYYFKKLIRFLIFEFVLIKYLT